MKYFLIVFLVLVSNFSFAQVSVDKESIKGKWINENSPNWKWEFKDDGKCYNYLDDIHTITYTYKIFSDSSRSELKFDYLELVNDNTFKDTYVYELTLENNRLLVKLVNNDTSEVSFVNPARFKPRLFIREDEKASMNDTTYIFSFSRSNYTDDKTDKFHHIKFMYEIPVTRSERRKQLNYIQRNIGKYRTEILKHPASQKMLDSLNLEILNLGLDDSLTKNIEVDFRDHIQYYCQVHRRVCLFRNYGFIQKVKSKIRYSNIAQWGKIFVEDVPISGYPIDSVIRVLGEPDSIISRYRFISPNNVGEEKYDTYYFKNSSFYVEEGRSYCSLESIDLTAKNYQINVNGHIFNQNTTLDEIKKIFPLSYLNKYPNYKTENYDTSVIVHLGKDEAIFDSSLIFRFKDEKLITFGYYVRRT